MVDVLIAEENLRFTISHFDFPCGDMDDQFLVDLAISRANEIMFKNYGRETIQFVKMVINQQVKHAKTYNHFYAIL
ncbi:hypothetical protein [Herbiconiux daphne]|uniref:Uncharacterized protein n=1 Tax=Herbiconiux daphne TaxID=2970914 RepID=A0ABT2HCA8_9MICO|nr:hypothetical protein [Herbiconiux daphne]MCS5737584.1 hypothetical protein [Herbiconiux daphne]